MFIARRPAGYAKAILEIRVDVGVGDGIVRAFVFAESRSGDALPKDDKICVEMRR
jgi:hypothetical protein